MSIEDLVKENPHDGFEFHLGEVSYNGTPLYSGKTVYLYFMMLHYFDHDQFSYNDLRTELYEDVDALFHQKSHTRTPIKLLLRLGVLEETGRDAYRVVKEFSDPKKLSSYIDRGKRRLFREALEQRKKDRRRLNIRGTKKRRLLSPK